MEQIKITRDKLLTGVIIGLAVVLVITVIAAGVIIYQVGASVLAPFWHGETKEPFPPQPANLYKPEDFVLQDGYMRLTAGDYMLGIDVSEWNGNIDWKAVKEAGIEFVYIRVGGRGWGQAGVMYEDGLAEDYYKGAKEQGLLVGAYFFSQATNAEEAAEEAQFCLAYTKDWEMDLPIVMDWEYVNGEARTAGISRRDLTDAVLSFCKTINGTGKKSALYCGREIRQEWMYPHEVQDIPFWLAMYTTNMTYPYEFAAWQYTGSGSVPGISTDVDINIMPIK